MGYQLNKTHSLSSGETARRIKAEESVDKLIRDVTGLKEELVNLQVNLVEQQELVNLKEQYIKDLETELSKLQKLKDKLEENLKEELVQP